MSRVRAKLAYIALLIGIWSGRLLVRLTPRKLLLGLFDAFADLTFRLFRRYRERSARNVETALGEHPPGGSSALVRGSLRNFFRSFVEIGLAVESNLPAIRGEVPAAGLEHLRAALAKKQGVIVLSAHIGNFMMLGTRLAADGLPAHVLINHPRGGPVGDLADRYRDKVGQKTIHARPRREAFRELGEILRQNGIAIVIADEFRSGSGVQVPFFGHIVTARRGPATLALRTGAAVVPAAMLRAKDGALRLEVDPEIDLCRTGDVKADVAENTRRMTRWLEKTVAAYPDQWNWFTVRWQDADPAAQPQKDLYPAPAAKAGHNKPEEETR
jgi:KDO2-lipid IV(A) lauroyltransferase